MTTDTKKFQEPSEQEIAEFAYYLWESEGRVSGRDLDYWLQAKAQLTKTRQLESGLLSDESIEKTVAPEFKAETNRVIPSRSQKPARKRQRTAREPVLA